MSRPDSARRYAHGTRRRYREQYGAPLPELPSNPEERCPSCGEEAMVRWCNVGSARRPRWVQGCVRCEGVRA